MFSIIYQFKLKAGEEETYQRYWEKVANYFKQNHGAIGSCLHKGEDCLWVAYSRWPNKTTRDNVWSGDNKKFPDEIKKH